MKCENCNTEISSTFKHAIIKNECPYCGGNLVMDEETLARVAEFQKTIEAELPELSPDSTQHLAKVLAIKFGLKSEPKPESMDSIKIAKSSFTKQAIENANIIRASDVNGISDAEREKIMTEVAAQRYEIATDEENIIENDPDLKAMLNPRVSSANSANKGVLGNLFKESEVSILEQERLARLSHQQNAIASGKGGFRRS